MVDKEYSILIDRKEFTIRVSDDEDGVLVVEDREEESTERIRIDQIDDALFDVSLGRRHRYFGCRRNGERISLVIEGRVIEADVKEARFREPEKRRAKNRAKGDLCPIVASIPGQIIKVRVSEGERVEKGQTLLLLSAMKLENEIQSIEEGTIETIYVREGETVDKEQVLLEIKT